MAQFWIPGDSDFALAMREPNLLVPGIKPVGRIAPKINLDGLWGFGGIGGKTDGSPLGVAYPWNADFYNRNNFHGYYASGSNEAVVAIGERGPGLAFDGDDASQGSCFIETTPFPLSGPVTVFVAAQVYDVTKKSALFGLYNGALTPLRKYGQGVHIEGGALYGSRAVNNVTQFASVTVSTGFIAAACSLGRGVLACNGVLASGTFGSSGSSYTPAIGEAGHAFTTGSNRARLDGIVYLAAIAYRDFSDAELLAFSSDPFGFLLEPANATPFMVSVPAGGGTPTLSSPGVINVQSDRATPQVTLTF